MLYNKISLNGSWKMNYSPENYTSDECPAVFGDIVDGAVPGYFEDMTDKFRNTGFFGELRINPEYKKYEYPMTKYPPDMSLPNYVGCFFYEKSFEISEKESLAYLYVEGVQNAASIWVNGVFLVRHEGYSAPFETKIPDEILVIGENKITLAVSNHQIYGFDSQPISGITSRAASRYSGGVTGDVEIRLYSSPLHDLNVIVSEDLSSVHVTLDCFSSCEAHWRILDDGKLVKEGKCKTEFTFDTKNLGFWSPKTPKLYTLEVSVGGATLERRFGIRRLLPMDAYFDFNGEPYYLRGICEHCYYPETVHPPHDKAFYEKVISKLKELGFNYIRFHTHVPPKEYLEVADEMGMLIQVESPNNASLAEWKDIISFCRKYTSVVIYCTGNELQIDDAMVEHIRAVADMVHSSTDALFSPMSAMRGVEYGNIEPEQTVMTPFRHNPRRFNMLSEFSDMYSSFSIEHFSYHSTDADPELVSSWHEVYKKPRVTHEICIDGCFADLSVKKRYEGTRIGETALFSSVEKHLNDKGVLDKAPLYFKNSSEWQRRLRKYCFEATRRCENMAGYDFLGPIDTHWHTFGYDVGMMNEFYELKPGESVRNVLRYNSPTVILTDLEKRRNYSSCEELSFKVLASVFEEDASEALLNVTLTLENENIYENSVKVSLINGRVYKLCDVRLTLPEVTTPRAMKLSARLENGRIISENEWELYVFPHVTETDTDGITVVEDISKEELTERLERGEKVVLLGAASLKHLPTSFRMSLAGRTSGFTATVINEHPILSNLPHEGFCSWQFCSLLEGGAAVIFDDGVPFNPIIEVATTHKNFIRESVLFEASFGKGRLIVCSLSFKDNDPAAAWLKESIIKYVKDSYAPVNPLSKDELLLLFGGEISNSKNTNLAFNQNDITATKK